MQRRFALLLGSLVLISILTSQRFDWVNLKASYNYPVHNLNTGLNFTTIQEGINAPETLNGHTIFVEKGTYYEHLILNKSLSLIGGDATNTIIDGNNTGNSISVLANNITIGGFTIQRAGSYPNCGIYVCESSTGNNISRNIIKNNENGLWLNASRTNSIYANNITDNYGAGVLLSWASDNTFSGNNFINNGLAGISLSWSPRNILRNNIMLNSTFAIGGYYSQDVDTSNKVNGKPIYYLVNRQNMQVPSDAGYVALIDSCNMTVRDLKLEKNQYGILIFNTTSSYISSNNITYCSEGIRIEQSSHNSLINNCLSFNSLGVLLDAASTFNTLSSNSITSSFSDGVYISSSSDNSAIYDNNVTDGEDGVNIEYSDGCILCGNNISGNRHWGVRLHSSEQTTIAANTIAHNGWIMDEYGGMLIFGDGGNLVFQNNFIDNDPQVEMVWLSQPPNLWDDGIEGNYWSNYNGTDANYDGIGDSPYVIFGGNIPEARRFDHYPLKSIFSSFNATSDVVVQTICNSSISEFQFNGTAIAFNVTGEDGTSGFCRICIPHDLMKGPYAVWVNNEPPSYINDSVFDNGTHRWVYFTYEHSTKDVVIIPEFSTVLVPLLVTTETLLIAILRKRKHIL